MVQTEQQYICIHQVRYKVKIPNKALPSYQHSLWFFLVLASTIHNVIAVPAVCAGGEGARGAARHGAAPQRGFRGRRGDRRVRHVIGAELVTGPQCAALIGPHDEGM